MAEGGRDASYICCFGTCFGFRLSLQKSISIRVSHFVSHGELRCPKVWTSRFKMAFRYVGK
jgi:hypothetical protein